jgi:hypothetical protein
MENPADENVQDLQTELKDQATEERDAFLTRIALSTALIAALAAVTGYLAGERGDEALVDQIQAGDQWSYYQAKSIKSNVVATKIETLQALTGKAPSIADMDRIARYEKEMQEIKEVAEEKQAKSEHRLEQRKILANGVTLFQISIAVAAISAITRKKALWITSLFFGLCGIIQLVRELFFS